jgi:CheY-like chemotaxis protein
MNTDTPDIEKKILLIDDEADFREVLKKALLKQGFEVHTASHGDEALRLAGEHLPSLIVCDLVMPGMSGYEVLRTLRANEKLAAIPVIFLTAQAEPAEWISVLMITSSSLQVCPNC